MNQLRRRKLKTEGKSKRLMRLGLGNEKVNFHSNVIERKGYHTSIENTQRDSIFREVCRIYNMNPREVKKNDHKRKREYVEIRQLTMVLMKMRLPFESWATVAGYFHKNHTTGIHAARTVCSIVSTDKNFWLRVKHLFNEEKPMFDFI